jgi:uncharacterized membrane protein YedE/YeeE
MQIIVAFLAGILFGVGLAVGGMLDPVRVRGFLDVTGRWDPTLAFVMGGALIPMIIAWRLRPACAHPLVGRGWHLPGTRVVTAELVIGSVLFGAGWGIAGLCPGPAIANLAIAPSPALTFLVAMVAGMALHTMAGRLGRAAGGGAHLLLPALVLLALSAPALPVLAAEAEPPAALTLEPTPAEQAAVLEGSRALADALMVELKSALGQAIGEQGVAGAVGVCRERAPAIAARLSRESGAEVSRKAMRNRHPDAVPDAVTAAVWPEFEQQPFAAPGRPRERLVAYEAADGRRLRYLRAIPTAAMCLGCHGSAIDPAVQAAIDRHYPEDRATGFVEGELRGVFSVDWPPLAAGPSAPAAPPAATSPP